jgi:hypothetical protein
VFDSLFAVESELESESDESSGVDVVESELDPDEDSLLLFRFVLASF